MLLLLLIAAVLRSFASDASEEGDPRGLTTYAVLVMSLALLSAIPVST
jgi:hypothetical protein